MMFYFIPSHIWYFYQTLLLFLYILKKKPKFSEVEYSKHFSLPLPLLVATFGYAQWKKRLKICDHVRQYIYINAVEQNNVTQVLVHGEERGIEWVVRSQSSLNEPLQPIEDYILVRRCYNDTNILTWPIIITVVVLYQK